MTTEGERKVSDGPEYVRLQNSQSLFPGKHHRPIGEQQLKIGRGFGISIASESAKALWQESLKRLEKLDSKLTHWDPLDPTL